MNFHQDFKMGKQLLIEQPLMFNEIQKQEGEYIKRKII